MAAAPSVPINETPALTQLQRVADTFVEPSKTFHDIRRSRSWWVPFLILTVLGYCFMGVTVKRVGWPTLAANVMKNNPKAEEQMSQQTREQRQRTMSMTRTSMQVGTYASPVIVLLSTAFLALLLWFGFAFLLGGTTDFRTMFTVVMYAWLPTAFVSILAIVTVMVADPETYNLAMPAPTSLGYFLDMDTAAWLRSLGGSLDIFTLWALVLCGFGGAIVSRVKPSRGIAMVLGAWFLYVLVKVGIAAAFS